MTRVRETRETVEDVVRRIAERSRKRATIPPAPREEVPESSAQQSSAQQSSGPESGAYSVIYGKRRRDD